jgi:NIPSNAP protein
MIYEMRIYRVYRAGSRLCCSASRRSRSVSGRIRFLDHADRRFQSRITYLLAWESLAEREKKWTEFMSDPRWISARAESERDGPIIQNARNQILQPTAFSAVR